MTPEGRLQLGSDPRLLAGSVCPLREAVAGLARRGLATLDIAWAMASEHPARFLGLATAAGLVTGAPADLTVFGWTGMTIEIRRTYKAGQVVYDRAGEFPEP